MSEWWTYRLSDFLMFSAATYWRLVERYNRELWPLHLAMLAGAALLLWLLAARRPGADRIMAAGLAGIWLWVGWAFHAQRYATINWAAGYFAWAFAAQAALLLLACAFLSRAAAPAARSRIAGLVLATAAVFAYPLAALVAGRPWHQAEVFGVAPDPTALATIGFVLAAGWARRWWLHVIPAFWLAMGWLTLWML